MTAQGGDLLTWLLDADALCAATYPGGDTNPYDFGSLCDQKDGHTGNHRALAEIAGGYRRHVVWAVDGSVLPDEETIQDHPHVSAAGQKTPPIEGDRVT